MVKGVYQITGLYRFSFGQEVLYKPTDTFTSENKNILDRLLASHGFWQTYPFRHDMKGTKLQRLSSISHECFK